MAWSRRRLLLSCGFASTDLLMLCSHLGGAGTAVAAAGVWPSKVASNRVELDPTGLRYIEGKNSLELAVEMASDRRGPYYIVYLWDAKAWIREMPEWCRQRRQEIVTEIKRLTSEERIDWVSEK